ncbi:C-type lectin domain family 4 member A isoform X2 [Choloepus didactylus]|uniref:C-type lectin domain family 4 member A isoform X2 n=1 Tax=Choloepus didactylus TaxID=27675 RepID=UPI0018A0F375|nr:C-type lectin domain family 4 member A isoform X2 [Choloepus didactylus]
MASEVMYAELNFENESKSSGTNSEPLSAPNKKTSSHKSNPSFPKLFLASLLILVLLLAISFFIAFIIFFQRYSQLKEKKTLKEPIPRFVECERSNRTTEEETWSCCPKNWSSHNSNCYFISTTSATWDKSEKICSEEGAHLLVINTKEEQDFIIQKLNKNSAYYVGLSHPEGKDQWQWVDQTPYNESVVFWHQDGPNIETWVNNSVFANMETISSVHLLKDEIMTQEQKK